MPSLVPRINISGNVTGQVAVGNFVYQAQANGGVINQFVVSEPIRAKPRPVDVRPRRDGSAIARTASLDRIALNLADGPVQIVAGEGWGKTALLRQAVYRAPLDTYRDGVALVSGWGLSVEDVEQAIFDAFFESRLPDMKLKASPGQLRTSLTEVAAGLVIDDLDLPRQYVDRIMDACGRCAFLSSAGEQTMWSGGSVVDLGGLGAKESVSLFERRVGRSLDAGERDVVARFASDLGGYPMGLVSAAAAVRRGALNIDQLPGIGAASDPTGEVHEAISETLTLRETRLLSALRSLDGAPLPSTALAAASGVEEPEADLATLRNDGILQNASPTYRLTSTTAEQLGVAATRTSTTAGLTTWCQEQSDPTAIASAGPAIITTIRGAIHDNANEAAIALGRSADAGLSVSGRWSLWEDVLEQVRRASVNTGDSFNQAWALHQLGTRAAVIGDTANGIDLLTQAMTIRKTIGDADGLQVTRHNLDLVNPPPPAPVESPPTTPAPQPHTGIPWRAWVVIIVGVVAVAGIVAAIALSGPQAREAIPDVVTTPPSPTPPATPSQGESEPPLSSRVEAEPPTVDFGSFGRKNRPASDRIREITITNTGEVAVQFGQIALEPLDGISAAGFKVSSDNCRQLAPNADCTITLDFTAPADVLGEFAAKLIIDHDASGSPIGIPVTGEVEEPVQ